MNDHYIAIDQCPLCGASVRDVSPRDRAGDKPFSHERAMMCGAAHSSCSRRGSRRPGWRNTTPPTAFSVDFRGAARPDAAATEYRDQRARRRWALLRNACREPAGSWNRLQFRAISSRSFATTA